MEETIKQELNKEVLRSIQNLKNLSKEDRKAEVENTKKLYELMLAQQDADINYDQKAVQTEVEQARFELEKEERKVKLNLDKEEAAQKKAKEATDQKKDKWYILAKIGEVLAPVGICVANLWMFNKTTTRAFRFEEHGTITSGPGRGIFNRSTFDLLKLK